MQKLGFSGYLTKPIKSYELTECITAVLENRQAESRFKNNSIIIKHNISEERRNRTRILLAEDNRVNQKVATKMLMKAGYSCDIAGNGLEVLEAIQKQSYDLILMDCQMPEMDGYETTRKIREEEKKRKGGMFIS